METVGLKQKPSLSLSRHYPASPEKVWRAWTDAEAVKKWWGPGPGEPVSLAELDVRAGGRFRIVFGGADGKAHECAGVYREVVPNRKLVFTWTWPNSTPERESLVTIVFKAVEGGTQLDFRHEQLFDEKVRDDHQRGWTGLLENLDSFLQSGT
ncbi:MAG TPA: SRPBCC domain-containing protein [Burkholderiales bacterium]|nr:SRPBCC domain-containing protein [Burkholderiales bacterium]